MNQEKEVLQKVEPDNTLYQIIEEYVPKEILRKNNRRKLWEYGYNEDYDMVIISKDGTIGDVYEIEGLYIAIPKESNVYQRSEVTREQKWELFKYPSELKKIQSSFHWDKKSVPFKNKWGTYIDNEFDRREFGFWFMNNGTPTYITGSHYMYLQWSKIDVGRADFREANRIFHIFWEACKADYRCYGIDYLKIRRSGFSFMAASEVNNIATMSTDARFGILSKTGADAKKLFTDKLVPISHNYPFFFKPIQDGMDKPKTELAYRIPATRFTRKNMREFDEDSDMEGLNTSIDWKNTEDNSYDGEKLKIIIQDESMKWLKPNTITANWRVTKTCLRLGSKIVGKCLMGSTCNAQTKGGAEGKALYYDSKIETRNKNGQTKSGLYAMFVPMEWNYEGHIDEYGMPVLRTPEVPVMGIDGNLIKIGAIDIWENEVASLSGDPDGLNEYYRQMPRTEAHAFRDESKSSLFNLTKIYGQADYNDTMMRDQVVKRGRLYWKDGIKDSKVLWAPDNKGRFYTSWIPAPDMQNKVIHRGGNKYPGNEHIGTFGCDSYDISGVVDGRGSNGALHGQTKFNMDDAPSNFFFLEYIARPATAEIFFEDVLMACVFWGMPILAENNKPRLLYHFKHRGYRKFSMNRPDRTWNQLSKTERELGGIPNTSQDIKQAHAAAIEAYVEKHVGIDETGEYRDSGDMGAMYFNRTLNDWAKFDINNRTKHDASISSGLAIMGNQRNMYTPTKEVSKINVTFARYNNAGKQSKMY